MTETERKKSRKKSSSEVLRIAIRRKQKQIRVTLVT